MKRAELRLPDVLHAQLVALAEKEHRSLNQQVIVLLEAALRAVRAADQERPA